MGKKPDTVYHQLKTPFEQHPCTWEETYPRPQMKRDSYLSLCGAWQLSVRQAGQERALGTIQVPFPPESRLSGIQRSLEDGEQYVYRRSFSLSADAAGKRILLHFGAVDQMAAVFVNDRKAGEHTGGYHPFTLDITEWVCEGSNTLRIEVADPLDKELPYGKQRKQRGGMWYTPISGIWQAVWLECVPLNYIRSLKITTGLDHVQIETVGGGREKTLVMQTPTCEKTVQYQGDDLCVTLEEPVLWSPENPFLYSFTLSDGEDQIESYFALRTITIQTVNGQACICLNGTPLFFHGLLDQGYFSDGIYLPASPEGYRYDILTMKRLGFNMLRKHIKIEPELFYYYCDKYGMIVFQDMVNSGRYSFLRDTALPTVGIKKGIVQRASPRRKAVFEESLRETVDLLWNHPSVCYYTIFNEGWGQFEADRLYREMKALDPTRIWDATSGWFTERESDVDSEHIYFRPVRLRIHPERPMVLSEFGGYACKIQGHAFNPDNMYGYRKFDHPAAFAEGLEQLYRREILPAIESGLSAAVLTQVSDVEDETNGLVTYDRQVVKVDEARMSALAENLHRAFQKKFTS